MTPWVQFALCLGLIGYAGTKLCRYGDAIGDKTGLGGTWIGLVLLATVTSLPELITGISSVTVADAPDIAVGDVLGSCMFNLLIIVVLDFMHRRESLYTQAAQGHVLSAGFGVVLIGFTGINLLAAGAGLDMGLEHISAYSAVVVALYVVAVNTVFRYEQRHLEAYARAEGDRFPDTTVKMLLIRYVAVAAVVILAGIWLPFIAKQLAEQMGWHQSFVGTLLVALVTSVPELVVTVAALRLNALDMAIANLFGSNLFNILILAVDDIAYTRGYLFADVSSSHAITAFSAVTMTGAAIVGLVYRTRARVLHTVGWASLALFSIYLLTTYALYIHGQAMP